MERDMLVTCVAQLRLLPVSHVTYRLKLPTQLDLDSSGSLFSSCPSPTVCDTPSPPHSQEVPSGAYSPRLPCARGPVRCSFVYNAVGGGGWGDVENLGQVRTAFWDAAWPEGGSDTHAALQGLLRVTFDPSLVVIPDM
jgi:hypothetical protein